MKNKKFLSLVLALVMVLGAFAPVFAETEAVDAKKADEAKAEEKVEDTAKKVEVKKVTGRDNKIQYLVDNKFVEGRKVNENPEDNDLALDSTIKRSEITKLLVYAIGRQDLAAKVQGVKIYNDVEADHWANGVITVGTTMASPANNVAFLNGYPDGSFKPEDNVTYGELAKMLVTIVKEDLTQEMHDAANKPGVWPAQWITWAAELGILEDVEIADANADANRADAFVMLYNALYAMKYIEKVPANETLGILSQLKNNKLTLNQGDYKKEFTLTGDTTFVLYNYKTKDVNAYDAGKADNNFAKAIRVSAIDNPEYYYGSLVRVLADDEGNVTHILELGNPKFLALGGKGWKVDPNDRWADVADATAETSRLVDFAGEDIDNAKLAKFNFDGGKAKEIAIWEGTYKAPENETLPENGEVDANNFGKDSAQIFSAKLTDDTRYFVADVEKNQLTEVKDLDAAILALGLTRASNWFSDVYVGYDSFDGTEKHETAQDQNVAGYNEAKVVVFNSVQKGNNDSQLLRVKNEATSLYDVTFEDVDGKEVVLNVEKYRGAFPFNFNDAKLDVVTVKNNAADGLSIATEIDHSDETKFPIVKVADVDGRKVRLEDKNGETAVFILESEFDQFLTSQDLEGKVIQFRTATGNEKKGPADEVNKIEIVSILKDGTALAGVLQNVAYANPSDIAYGHVKANNIKVTADDNLNSITMKEYYDFYNKDEGTHNVNYFIDHEDAENLVAFLGIVDSDGTDIRYEVQKDYDSKKKVVNIEVLVNNKWVALDSLDLTKVNDVQDAIDGLSLKPVVEKAVKAARADYDALSDDEKALVDEKKLVEAEAAVEDAEKTINKAVDALENETVVVAEELDGNGTYNDVFNAIKAYFTAKDVNASKISIEGVDGDDTLTANQTDVKENITSIDLEVNGVVRTFDNLKVQFSTGA